MLGTHQKVDDINEWFTYVARYGFQYMDTNDDFFWNPLDQFVLFI